jgi:predicted metal-dependent phosphoesterase TrpH
MKIDLHTHTYPASSCSNMAVEQLILAARERSLDGICLTEHNKPWDRDEVSRLRDEFDFQIFRGMEVTTRDGDILVFGLDEPVRDILTATELRLRLPEDSTYMIAAHPFRGFLMFGFSQLALTPERAADRPVFRAVNAIEAYNCKVTQQESEMAFDVANRVKLPCVAGSDAHTVADVGTLFTCFDNTISTDEELIAELVAERFSLDHCRNGK